MIGLYFHLGERPFLEPCIESTKIAGCYGVPGYPVISLLFGRALMIPGINRRYPLNLAVMKFRLSLPGGSATPAPVFRALPDNPDATAQISLAVASKGFYNF